MHLDPVPASVGQARRFVQEHLGDLSDDALDIAVLLTSELVTNAILHARTPVQLGLVRDDDTVMVAVGDRAPAEMSLEPRSWSKDRPGGRGLALVAEMSDSWGTSTHTGGKTVWFVLPAEQAEPWKVG
ncbi:MAG: ATP-binding protein [Actinomycetes bacterium]